jgi:hypothetical protein
VIGCGARRISRLVRRRDFDAREGIERAVSNRRILWQPNSDVQRAFLACHSLIGDRPFTGKEFEESGVMELVLPKRTTGYELKITERSVSSPDVDMSALDLDLYRVSLKH